jgi:hypothetical protein
MRQSKGRQLFYKYEFITALLLPLPALQSKPVSRADGNLAKAAAGFNTVFIFQRKVKHRFGIGVHRYTYPGNRRINKGYLIVGIG